MKRTDSPGRGRPRVRGSPADHAAERFVPYVPRLAAEWSSTNNVDVRLGSLASVDLSGFTALTERLVEHGRAGAEEINSIVSAIFTDLIDVVHAEGGDVLSFGGDAILVWFDADDVGDPDAVRAARCTAEMQRRIAVIGKVVTTAGRVRMRMSVGVHRGELVCAVIGGDERQLVTIGPVATTTVELEADAKPGQILISDALAAELPPRWHRLDTDGRVALRLGAIPRPDIDSIVIKSSSWQPRSSSSRTSFVPTPLRDEIGHLIGEHRLATVAFIKVAGTDALVAADTNDAVAALDRFARRVSDVCATLAVTWLACDISPDSVKFVIVGGAPVSHEDDEERVLRACRQLVDDEPALTLDVGVNAGPVYLADLGHPLRRTVTSMGDTVNLAARLMAKAEAGQIVASEAVTDRTFSTWDAEPLQPFRVKGKSELQRAAIVGHPAERRAQCLGDELLGRDAELEVIRSQLVSASAGMGGTIDIVAPSGTGKSALVTRALDDLDASGLTIVRAAGNPYLTASAYRSLATALRELFAVESPDALAALIDNSLLAQRPLMPLLAQALGWTVPETTESRQIDGEFKQARTAELIAALVQVISPAAVLWADDVQWFDDASLSALSAMSRSASTTRLVVIVTRRPEGAQPQLSNAHSLPLGLLTDDTARRLVNQLAIRPLHTHVVDAIVARANGHPFFLRALTAAMSSGGRSSADDGSLPPSAERAAAAVLDQLPPNTRANVRHLAVAGGRISLATLAEAMGDPSITEPHHWRQVEEVVELRGSHAVFRHDLFRDAAYQGLSVSRRRWLHGRLADALTSNKASGPRREGAELTSLAMHYELAGRYREAWTAAVSAAQGCARAGAWVDANTLWSRAIRVGTRLRPMPQNMREVLSESATASERVGELIEAENRLRRANRLEQKAPTLVDIARVMQRQGRSKEARRVAIRAIQLATSPKQLVDAELRRASIEEQLGRYRPALSQALALLDRGELTDDERGRAALLAQQSMMVLGDQRQVEFGRVAVSLLSSGGPTPALGNALNNQAAALRYSGDLFAAALLNEQAIDTFKSCGDEIGLAIAANNLGEIRIDQGRLRDASTLFDFAAGVFGASNDVFTAACVETSRGAIALRERRLEDAISALKAAREVFEGLQAPAMALDVDLRLCEVALWERRALAALTFADDCALRALKWPAGGMNHRWARRLRVWALSQLGREYEARAEAVELLDDARSREALSEIAMSLATLEALDKAVGRPIDVTAQGERLDLMKRLDMVWVPELPVWPGTLSTRQAEAEFDE